MNTTINITLTLDQAKAIKSALESYTHICMGNIDQLSALVAAGETSLNEEKQAHLISLVDEYKQKDDGIIRGIYHKDNHIKVKRAYETLKILAKTIESTNKYPSPYGTVDSSGLARRITADPLPEATVENQNQVTISNELDGCCIGLDEDHQHQVNLDYCIYSDEERAMNALASSGTIGAYNDIAQKTMAAPISVLKNLNVDIELRNNGYGSELMEKYLEDVDRHKSDSILVADLCQSNQFSLIAFYQKYGYKLIDQENSLFPIMFRKAC